MTLCHFEPQNSQDYHVPRDLLARYAAPGPRYTSYPTAPVWHDDFGPEQAREIYAENREHGASRPLALYFHVPFCTSLCWYCGCNVKIQRNKSVTEPYLRLIESELEAVTACMDCERPISQMHWGGGTPTYLTPTQIRELVGLVTSRLRFAPDAEISVEVDPRVTTQAHLEALRACGFNRLSMGVQDFNPLVQEAVHRVQSFEDTQTLIENSRQMGFKSVNIDLMYGLPHQSVESFETTLKQVRTLSPDRIALFHYAHIPWLKPAQKLIREEDLPSSEVKLDIFELAIDTLIQQGYRYIGMDHFARPEDELSQAQLKGSLRRNFMGYTTQAGTDLYGFGVSSISEIDGHFIQNAREIQDYTQRVEAGQLPVLKGMRLSQDDHLRKAVIEHLICNGFLDFAEIEARFELDFEAYFAPELEASRALIEDNLLRFESNGIRVRPRGQILIRNVCMIWDAYLKAQRGQHTFSRTV